MPISRSANFRRWAGISLALACLAAPARSIAQWPFSSPAAPSATPFQGFSDANDTSNPYGEPDRDVPLVEKPFDQLSNQYLDLLGQKALSIRPTDWKHAETDNFILHYRRVTEAKKVAREVEYDLWFVATTLGATKEQYQKKSHVFIFEDDKEWGSFVSQTTLPQWVASFAQRDELFLNLRNVGGMAFDSHLLAHETTHAVVARLYPGARWPLWLSEGFAEYMGGASVAGLKNQTVRRQEHVLDFASMSLDQLQQTQKYPDDPIQVAELYETAEKLIRFIMTELPRERFTQFINAVLAGRNLKDALLYVYPDKLASYEDFERKFEKFSK